MEEVIDLFCGAGGLAQGFEQVGFNTAGIDYDEDAVATYKKNHGSAYQHDLSSSALPDEVDNGAQIVVGGFPCQPFSAANNHKDRLDDRSTLGDSYVDIVETVNPKHIVLENVSGLVNRHTEYFEHICSRINGLGYEYDYKIVNTADYGVPQTRHRLILIGSKTTDVTFPEPTHETHRGVGEVLKDIVPFEHKSGGRTSGSKWRPHTEPSHTITAQANNVVREEDSEWRWWTVDEMKKIQTFPETYEFVGNKTSTSRQIGNAVPPRLATVVAEYIREL